MSGKFPIRNGLNLEEVCHPCLLTLRWNKSLGNKCESNYMQRLVIVLVINCSSTFRASLRPSSEGQTAFSLSMVICPVVTVVMLESRLANNVHCV